MRVERGMTLGTFASRLGVTRFEAQRMERDGASLSPEQLYEIAQAFRAPIGDLFAAAPASDFPALCHTPSEERALVRFLHDYIALDAGGRHRVRALAERLMINS